MRLSFLDRLLGALRREKADVTEAWEAQQAKLDEAMDRKEAELGATPEERLAQVQRDIDDSAGDLEEIRRRIEGVGPAGPDGPATPA